MKVKRIYYGEHEWQYADLRLPSGTGPFPVAVVIHGGFWRAKYGLDLMNKFSEALTSKGIATWNIEYHRVGHEGGGWPGTFTDVGCAVDFLKVIEKTFSLDLENVLTIGHSAGGHLALWLAARHKIPAEGRLYQTDVPLPIKGVVSLAGIGDLDLMQDIHRLGGEDNPTIKLIGGSPDECPDRYADASPIKLLPFGVPQILIHGSLDVDVPIGMSEHYEKAASDAGDPVRLVKLNNAEHFKIIDPDSDVWPVVVQSVLELLHF